MKDSIEYNEMIAHNIAVSTQFKEIINTEWINKNTIDEISDTDTEWLNKSLIDEIRSARDSIANMARREGMLEEDRRLLMIAVSSIDWLMINYYALDKACNQLKRELEDE